jgi:cell fate regulator YaaT (PSP1 superfamily)
MSDNGKSGGGKPPGPGGGGGDGQGRPRRRRRRRGRGRGSRPQGQDNKQQQGGKQGQQGQQGRQGDARKGGGESKRRPEGGEAAKQAEGARRRSRSSRRRRRRRSAGQGREGQRGEARDRQEHQQRPAPQPRPEPEVVDEGPRPDFETMTVDQLTFLKPHVVDEEVLLDDLPIYEIGDEDALMDVVGVKLHASGRVSLYDCQNMHLEQGDEVIVETGRGLALGEVVIPATRRFTAGQKLSRVIRKASQHDMRQRERNRYKETDAFRICIERIESLRLPMKLIRVDYLHGGNKAVFYFSAEGRIDFRELVRDLARRLHIRVEMRQIGVRDASRMLGGIGSCGLKLCCNRYIREFAPVSIRMAKDQDLVLNPEKVSGICGRLMCCLAYEDSVYKEAARDMPRVGRRVQTPSGVGRIKDRDVLKRVVRVQLADQPGLHEFPVADVSPVGDRSGPQDKQPRGAGK